MKHWRRSFAETENIYSTTDDGASVFHDSKRYYVFLLFGL
jgi:hypothetical protein